MYGLARSHAATLGPFCVIHFVDFHLARQACGGVLVKLSAGKTETKNPAPPFLRKRLSRWECRQEKTRTTLYRKCFEETNGIDV